MLPQVKLKIAVVARANVEQDPVAPRRHFPGKFEQILS
jgi:hypothetical protein